MWLIVVGCFLVFILGYFLSIRSFKHWEDKGVPYIKPLPLFGNTASNLFKRRAFAHLTEDFYNAYPDKRYVGFYQFLTPMLLLRDPELIKRITIKEFDTFPQHRAFVPDNIDPLWSKNLFAIRDAPKWHDMRATLSPSFTSSKMRMMFGLIKDCSRQFTDYFQKLGGGEVELKDVFTRCANDVIATTAFGITCDSLKHQNNEFYLMGKDATNFSGIRGLKFAISTISPKLMTLLNVGIFSKSVDLFFRRLISNTIQVREANGIIRPDMIHLLMEARKGRLKDDDANNGAADLGFAVVQESGAVNIPKRQKTEITDEDITAQALVFFFAGFETAATFMCFTAYELAINPEIQANLRKEVDDTLKNCNGDFTYEALLGMKYLDMVASESLRKWPPAIQTDRASVKPFTIEPEQPGEKPVVLEKDSNIWVPIFAMHRDPKYYPNPEKFDPERFGDENKDDIKPYTYLPFGIGPRNCIGSRFALLEGKLVIAEILSKFEIVPVTKTQIPLQLDQGCFNLVSQKGFWLAFIPRAKRK